MRVCDLFFLFSLEPQSEWFVLRSCNNNAIGETQNRYSMCMALQDVLTGASCSIPDSSRTIPRTAHNFLWNGLMQTIDSTRMPLKNSSWVSAAINMHYLGVFTGRIETVLADTIFEKVKWEKNKMLKNLPGMQSVDETFVIDKFFVKWVLATIFVHFK